MNLIHILFAILYKWSTTFTPYSGKNTPPTFGDFEAQRHWLELSINLPAKQWYHYDREYWPLDYPPLTAYHSYILGFIASKVDPKFVELVSSRGLETPEIITFMRLTSLFSDMLVFVPSILYFHNTFRSNIWPLLILPAFNLIDHGHFQFILIIRYNSVMLGLSLFSIMCIINKRFILGSVFFVCAIMFKQMALFYSLPIFFYLLVNI